MSKSRIFQILSLCFIVGIAFASFYPNYLDDYHLFFGVIFSLILMFIFYQKKPILVIGFSFLLFFGGVFLVYERFERLEKLDSGKKDFSGKVVIVKEPRKRENRHDLVVRPMGENERDQKFLVYGDLYDEFEYGDVLEISCKLERPEKFDESFDYPMYLAKDGIYYICRWPEIVLTGRNEGNFFYKKILAVKYKAMRDVGKSIPAPESDLILGLMFGGGSQMSKGLKEDFTRTGLNHIVAISGYHVGIVAQYLMILGIGIGLWRKQAFWLSLVGLLIFIALAGFPPSAVRAGVMGSLLLWAVKNGRLGSSQNAIIFAACIMLFHNPMLLRWDIGFQLSFMATLGIINIYPLLQKYTGQGLKKGALDILFVATSAQIFVLPIILYNFSISSLVWPLSNVLVLPLVPFIMLLGFMIVISGFVFPPAGMVVSWITFLALKYETVIVGLLADMKYSAMTCDNFNWQIGLIWYIMVLYVLRIFKSGKNEKGHRGNVDL